MTWNLPPGTLDKDIDDAAPQDERLPELVECEMGCELFEPDEDNVKEYPGGIVLYYCDNCLKLGIPKMMRKHERCDHPEDESWRVGSDVFSARYYLIDCVIRQWGAIEDAEEILQAARKAIDKRFPKLEAKLRMDEEE